MTEKMRVDPTQAYLDVTDWHESRVNIRYPMLLDSIVYRQLDLSFSIKDNTIEYSDSLKSVNNPCGALIIHRIKVDYRYYCGMVSKHGPEIAQSVTKRRFSVDLPLSAYLAGNDYVDAINGSLYLGSRLIGPEKALVHGEKADMVVDLLSTAFTGLFEHKPMLNRQVIAAVMSVYMTGGLVTGFVCNACGFSASYLYWETPPEGCPAYKVTRKGDRVTCVESNGPLVKVMTDGGIQTVKAWERLDKIDCLSLCRKAHRDMFGTETDNKAIIRAIKYIRPMLEDMILQVSVEYGQDPYLPMGDNGMHKYTVIRPRTPKSAQPCADSHKDCGLVHYGHKAIIKRK